MAKLQIFNFMAKQNFCLSPSVLVSLETISGWRDQWPTVKVVSKKEKKAKFIQDCHLFFQFEISSKLPSLALLTKK